MILNYVKLIVDLLDLQHHPMLEGDIPVRNVIAYLGKGWADILKILHVAEPVKKLPIAVFPIKVMNVNPQLMSVVQENALHIIAKLEMILVSVCINVVL